MREAPNRHGRRAPSAVVNPSALSEATMPSSIHHLSTSLLAAAALLVGCGSERGGGTGGSTSATSGTGGPSSGASTGDLTGASSTTSSVSAGVGGQGTSAVGAGGGAVGAGGGAVGAGGSSAGPCDPAPADTMCEGCV